MFPSSGLYFLTENTDDSEDHSLSGLTKEKQVQQLV
jgi:hypothetical protein